MNSIRQFVENRFDNSLLRAIEISIFCAFAVLLIIKIVYFTMLLNSNQTQLALYPLLKRAGYMKSDNSNILLELFNRLNYIATET